MPTALQRLVISIVLVAIVVHGAPPAGPQRLQSTPFDNFRVECSRMAGATAMDIQMVGSVGLKRHDIVIGLTCEAIEELFPWYGIPMGIADMEREDCHYSQHFDPIIDESQEFTCGSREYLAGITRLADTRIQTMCCRLRTRDEDRCVVQYYSKPLGAEARTEIRLEGYVINAIAVEELSFRVRFCSLTPRAVGLIYIDLPTTTVRPSTTATAPTSTITAQPPTTTSSSTTTTTTTTTTPFPTSSRRVVIYKRPPTGRLVTLETIGRSPSPTSPARPSSTAPTSPAASAATSSAPSASVPVHQHLPPPEQSERGNNRVDDDREHVRRPTGDADRPTTSSSSSPSSSTTDRPRITVTGRLPMRPDSVDEETAKSPFEDLGNATRNIPSLARRPAGERGRLERPRPPPPPPPPKGIQVVDDDYVYDPDEESEIRGALERQKEIRRKPALGQPKLEKDSDPTPPLKILDQKMYIGFPDKKPEAENPAQNAQRIPLNSDAVKTMTAKEPIQMPALIIFDGALRDGRQRDPENKWSTKSFFNKETPMPPGVAPPHVAMEALIPMNSMADDTSEPLPFTPPPPTSAAPSSSSLSSTPSTSPPPAIFMDPKLNGVPNRFSSNGNDRNRNPDANAQYDMPEYEPYDPVRFYHTPPPAVPVKEEMVLSFCTKEIALRDTSNLIIACGSDTEVWMPARCPPGSQCFVANDSIYRICCAVSYGR